MSLIIKSRFIVLLFVTLLLGCGGSSSSDSSIVSQVSIAGTGSTLQVKLVDASGALVKDSAIDVNSTDAFVQATVRDSLGVPIPRQLVTFSTNPVYGSFLNGSTAIAGSTVTGTYTVSQIKGITDASGIAKVQLGGRTLGADAVLAEVKISTTSVSTSMPYQITSALATIPSGLVFNSALPTQLMINTIPTGTRQSTVKFNVNNNRGGGVSGQSVRMSLDAQSVSAGVTFVQSDGTGSNTAQTVKSDIDGVVQIVVNAGSLPTSVIVTAVMVSNPVITATSLNLSVSNGRIKQGTMSLSNFAKYVEGFDLDGVSTVLTVIVTDRLGNPVPSGTVINFITSHGLIGRFDTFGTFGTSTEFAQAYGSCTLDSASTCKVALISSGVRPSNGQVNVLAYADGEEAFVELPGLSAGTTNRWMAGYPFTDMGSAYLDVNGNGVYDVGIDQVIPGGQTGTAVCAGTALSIANTCDGTWSDFIRVRERLTVIWSTSQAKISLVGSRAATGFVFSVLDLNGNPMATGSTVVINKIATNVTTSTVSSTGAIVTTVTPNTCKILDTSPGSTLANANNYTVLLDGGPDCNSAVFKVTVTSQPSGVLSTTIFQ